jgi:dihydroflavonol-4-reductase
MRVFVSGANGFIGSHLCRRLVEIGVEVRGLVRAGSDKRLLDGVPVEVVEGDILDRRSLDLAMAGCDQVFHTAATVRFFVRDESAMWRTNVDGTRNVLEAARAANVKRFVHTSTVAFLKRGHLTPSSSGNGSVASGGESCVANGNEIRGAYALSKLEAEKLVLSAAADGFPAVVCSPSGPLGPGDFRPSPIGKVIIEFLKGRILAYTDTGLNVVDVRDVATGHVLAAEKGKVGERYVLAGENLALLDFFGLLSVVSGVRPPRIRLPYGVALTFGFFGEIMGRITGREPLACLDSVRSSKQPHYFSSDKARDELGYASRPVPSSLAEEVTWFRDNGFV